MHFATLFPHAAGLHPTEIAVADGTITLQVRPTARTAACPLCHFRSRRVRSTYTRALADLPCGGLPARVLVRIRRFTCSNSHCPRRVFAERLLHSTAPYARQTHLRQAALQRIGMALGGNAGVRLAVPLGLPPSRPTRLRLVRAIPIPAGEPPRIVGIDEWAWRAASTMARSSSISMPIVRSICSPSVRPHLLRRGYETIQRSPWSAGIAAACMRRRLQAEHPTRSRLQTASTDCRTSAMHSNGFCCGRAPASVKPPGRRARRPPLCEPHWSLHTRCIVGAGG